MLTDVEIRAIEGTTEFFQELTAGLVSPDDANDRLLELSGPIPENEHEDRLWETSVVGTIAHDAGNIIGTPPVVILDWNANKIQVDSNHKRAPGAYVWAVEERPARRPRTPHRIEDNFLLGVARKNLGRAAVSKEIVALPIIANYEHRTVFEIAVVAVFPAWGAWAWRRKVHLAGRWSRSPFEAAIASDDATQLENWIVAAVGIGFTRQNIQEAALEGASADAYWLTRDLAEDFQKGRR